MKPDEYAVAWICALPIEMAVAEAMLDEFHEPLPRPPQDDNAYTFGRLGKHNIILACLPAGVIGVTSAAVVAEKMLQSFPSIRVGLMVGIGAGVPSEENDIRLGDVVASMPSLTEGGVIQYDFGKTIQNGDFQRTGTLNKPPDLLLGAMARLQARHIRQGHQIDKYLADMLDKYPRMRSKHMYQGREHDRLFEATYDHPFDKKNCTECDHTRLIFRSSRDPDNTVEVFYGLIASGNQVMRHGVTRDRLGAQLGVLCFEMEAAGLIGRLPCLVIRGICDYADSHKNKQWQPYAAATAAAYAKELLYSIPADDVMKEQPIREVLDVDPRKKYKLGLNLPDNTPLIDDDSFIGREVELSALTDALSPRSQLDSQRIAVVSGLGGVGKTQLTISFAKRNTTLFDAIFWLDASSESKLRHSFVIIASCVFQSKFTGPEGEEMAVNRVQQWLSEKDNYDWLLIFDNYDNPLLHLSPAQGDEEPGAYNLRSYFPHVSHGAILVSTRYPNLNWGKQVRLKCLEDLEQSVEILANRSGRPEAKQDSNARKLASRLDGLPLALVTAGSYLSQAPDSFQDYLQLYTDSWKELESTTSDLLDYQGRTLYSTWNISYERIRARDPDAARLLQFLAYLDNQDIWFELVQKGKNQGLTWFDEIVSSKIRFNQAMKKLQDYSLVEIRAETGSWSLHNCVHDWTLDCLNTKIDKRLHQLAIHCVGELIACESEMDYWKINRRLLRHADRSKQKRLYYWIDESVEQRQLDSIHELGCLYGSVSRLDEAEKLYKRALEGYEKILSADEPLMLDTINDLGNLYFAQNKLAEAEKMHERALIGYGKALGPDHLTTLDTVNNLGVLYTEQGKLNEAEMMFVRAFEGYRKVTAEANAVLTLDTFNNLGNVYHDQGKLDQAELMYERALKVKEKAFSVDHPSTLDTVHNLGLLYGNQGKLDKAEKMYERALKGKESALGADHISTSKVLRSFAEFCMDQIRRENLGESPVSDSDPIDHSISTEARLRRCLKSLLSLARFFPMQHFVFGHLGRSFIWLGDLKNAEIAFQQQIGDELDSSKIVKGAQCAGCYSTITPSEGRYVCMTCREIDLCHECHARHVSKILRVSGCEGHGFFEVPFEPAYFWYPTSRGLWLQPISDGLDAGSIDYPIKKEQSVTLDDVQKSGAVVEIVSSLQLLI